MAEKAKIYTKGGDQGETSLLGGTRVLKSHERVEAYGNLDELNAFVGLLRDHLTASHDQNILLEIQNQLFIAEALIASDPDKPTPGLPSLSKKYIETLEHEIDEMTTRLPPLTSFILPGGHPFVSYCHLARTICRRAERSVISLNQHQPVDQIILQYLNRLSDYFFILARKTGSDVGVEQIRWPSEK